MHAATQNNTFFCTNDIFADFIVCLLFIEQTYQKQGQKVVHKNVT